MTGGRLPATSGTVRERLQRLLRDEFGLCDAAITDTTDLAGDLLIDSLAKVELAMVVEDELSIGLADTELAEIRTFGELHAAVSARVVRAQPAAARTAS
ncbi:MAG: acyl carrier protein [Euzebyales bacterium]|nr:acyl carrier protein [Euzebyales bacterium]